MENIRAYTGIRLRSLRSAKGLTQEKLADSCGVHPTYIGQIERGEKNVTIECLFCIIKALDVTLSEFFSEAETIFEPADDQLYKTFNTIARLSKQSQSDMCEIVARILALRV